MLHRLARPFMTLTILAVAAAVAAACGSDSESSDATTSADPGQRAMAWLPADTWLVARASYAVQDLDTAIETLDRLPIWALVEGLAPARDAAGLREAAFQEIAKSTKNDDREGEVTVAQLDAAIGEHAGIAVIGNDLEQLNADEPPVAGWIEVRDEDAADELVRALAEGKVSEERHGGATYLVDESGEGAILIEDELLLFATKGEHLERMIDANDDGETLAENDDARAVLDVAADGTLGTIAIASDDAMDLVVQAAQADADTKSGAAQFDDVRELLATSAIDGMISEWVGVSMGLDETGLRMVATWSNPRDLADPDTDARELAERSPATALQVQAGVTDGTQVQRLQAAWTEIRAATGIDLGAVEEECGDVAKAAACRFGARLAAYLLEDEDLADDLAEAGASSYVTIQDNAALTQAAGTLATLSDPAEPVPAPAAGSATPKAKATPTTAAAAPAPTASQPADARLVELATTDTEYVERLDIPNELAAAAAAVGITVTNDDEAMTVSVKPTSPVLNPATAETTALLQQQGVPAAALTAGGVDLLTAEIREVDDLLVIGMPAAAASTLIPALEGDTETLTDSPTYQDVTAAVKAPERVGAYLFTDLAGSVTALFDTLAASEPDVARAAPSVRNNLADVPGLVGWSARTEHEGQQVGIAELRVPILE